MNGWVINGVWFPYGIAKFLDTVRIVEEANVPKTIIENTLNKIEKEFSKNLIIKTSYVWSYSTWFKQYVPSYMFQFPLKFKENERYKVELVALKILESIDAHLGFKGMISIAYGYGEMIPNKTMPQSSNGEAYFKTGRYIDNFQKCIENIKKDRIKFVV
jgi:hypothetical protein